VAEMSEIAHRTLGEDIVIRTQLAADLDPVYLDHVQAEAAFLNLAINARDAMPDGGTLFIETSEVIREKNETSDQLELFPGRYILLSITDTGTGMSPDVLAHAVEPFFTTKDVGKGTGLGLSMTYGFIKQSGGDVKIYSEPGTGTAVKLFLPTAQGRNVSGSKTESSEPDLTGNETILLVEDEEHVRNYAIMQIEQLGYHVISASDGASALQKIKQLDGQVDLLFTDVTMPGGMNGRQLAQNIAGLYPNLKVLYTSGYNQNAIIHAGKLEPGVALLEKPYHKIDLARKLRELLDDDSRSRL
jgi:CheY-like chemotaxis protein